MRKLIYALDSGLPWTAKSLHRCIRFAMSLAPGNGGGGAAADLPTKAKEIVMTCMKVTEQKVKDSATGEDLNGFLVICVDCRNYRKEFTAKQGLTNACNHFRSCVKERYSSLLAERHKSRLDAERDAMQQKVSAGTASPAILRAQTHLKTITNVERSLEMWIEHIVLKNGAFSDVECPISRRHHMYTEVKSTKKVVDTMHHLVELVEEKIADRMEPAQGCQISFDGWTANGTHYVNLFCSYPVESVQRVGGEVTTTNSFECRLIACAPLQQMEDEDGDNSSDSNNNTEENFAVSFNTKHHVHYIEETFSFYRKDITLGGKDHDFIKCQVCDSTALNPAIARALRHYCHISCANHDLSLAVNKMVELDEDLKSVIATVTKAAVAVRNSCKHATALRNEAVKEMGAHGANIRAKGDSVTRQWLGEATSMERHLKIRSALTKIMDAEVGTIAAHRESVESTFITKLEKHNKKMRFLLHCSTKLQEKHLALHKCRSYLDTVISQVDRKKKDRNSIWYRCKLQDDKIRPDNGLCSNPDFVTGVAKIQQGVAYELDMTRDEKDACAHLLKAPLEEEEAEVDEEDFMATVNANDKRKAKEMAGESDYINCKFILGSSASTCEAMWSVADEVLGKRRQGMSPRNFEAILFLKFNKDLWDINLVAEADQRRKKTDRDSRAKQRISENEEHNNIEAMMADVIIC